MRRHRVARACLITLFTALPLAGCQQENPVEQAGQDITEHTRDAIDKAKDVGGTLEDAAERTAGQVRDASE